jgi:hypothetical protein
LPESAITRLETQIVAPQFRYSSGAEEFNLDPAAARVFVATAAQSTLFEKSQPAWRVVCPNSAL